MRNGLLVKSSRESAELPAGNAHADVMQANLGRLDCASFGIAEVGVAAIDHDVSRLQ